MSHPLRPKAGARCKQGDSTGRIVNTEYVFHEHFQEERTILTIEWDDAAGESDRETRHLLDDFACYGGTIEIIPTS